uniref:Uncharacterized protein n=1 Tax=Anguilla anguilla TaxID=7936 RepID=A0A0E9TUJ5_ANGAN
MDGRNTWQDFLLSDPWPF